MLNAELFISVDALNRLIFFALYLPLGLLFFWRIYPRLLPAAKRLAALLLIVQILLIVMSLTVQPSDAFERWLWRLNGEWNVPATFASTQMALVGAVSLATAWLARSRPAGQRLYFAAIGLVFLFAALDEYRVLHEYVSRWRQYYAVLGLAVVTATLAIAGRTPRRTLIWHVLFLAGLAISASGALVLEHYRDVEICERLLLLRLDGCLRLSLYEEYLELSGMFLALAAMLGQFSESSPLATGRSQRALYALPVLWLVLLLSSDSIIPVARQAYAQPATAAFESGAQLHAFRIERFRKEINAHLYLSPGNGDFSDFGYSLHLVDQVSGDSLVSSDKHVSAQIDFLLAPGYVPVYRQWTELKFPAPSPVNRAMWIVLALWRERNGDFLRQQVLSSDRQLLENTQIALAEFALPGESTPPAASPIARFGDGFTLEAVAMPLKAVAGETLFIAFSWRSDVAGAEDYAQFLHLLHQETGAFFGYDQEPLGPRIPTRLWYAGLSDTEDWRVPLPADLAPGRYNVYTGLYRARDQERLPASDAAGSPFQDARAPLGKLTVYH